jgi:hypothetical protein
MNDGQKVSKAGFPLSPSSPPLSNRVQPISQRSQISWGLPLLTLIWLVVLLNGCEESNDLSIK